MDTLLTPSSSTVDAVESEPESQIQRHDPFPRAGSDNLKQLHDAVDQTGSLKVRAADLTRDVGVIHKVAIDALHRQLTDLTERQLKLSIEQVLNSLVRGYGMSWSDLARATGVTQQAIRKWRQGGRPSPESRTRLAELGACMALLQHADVSEPASWLELPIVSGYAPRRFDMFLSNHYYELVALARNEITPDEAIASLDPQWQARLLLRHEVFLDSDGKFSVKAR